MTLSLTNIHMDKTDKLVAALVGAINASTRPPALWSLPPVKYIPRQIEITELADGTYEVRYYHRYKNRRPKSESLPVNGDMIRDALNSALLSVGVTVTAVVDSGTYIQIILKLKKGAL